MKVQDLKEFNDSLVLYIHDRQGLNKQVQTLINALTEMIAEDFKITTLDVRDLPSSQTLSLRASEALYEMQVWVVKQTLGV